MTSFYSIALVRKLSGERRVGHAGTLDPLASGVQVIGIGKGTRALEFISGTKIYRASIELGVTTDTYDADGVVLATSDPSGVTLENIKDALKKLEGEVLQVPPAYSAIKQGGRRLYELARAGRTVVAPPRTVIIHRIDITGWATPLLDLEVECGRGTYVRSIAHDLGQSLGCGGYLKGLQRSKDGPFCLSDSVSLDELPDRIERDGWRSILMSVDTAMQSLRPVAVGDEYVAVISNGGMLPVEHLELSEEPVDGELFRVYSREGVLLAVSHYRSSESALKPRKVFAAGS